MSLTECHEVLLWLLIFKREGHQFLGKVHYFAARLVPVILMQHTIFLGVFVVFTSYIPVTDLHITKPDFADDSFLVFL